MEDIKHPFRIVTAGKKDNSKKTLALNNFKAYIRYWFENSSTCYDLHPKWPLNCNCYAKMLSNEHILDALGNIIGQMAIAVPDLRNHLTKEVIGSGYTVSKVKFSHNLVVYTPVKAMPDYYFYKYTTMLIFKLEFKKFKTITIDYSNVNKKERIIRYKEK